MRMKRMIAVALAWALLVCMLPAVQIKADQGDFEATVISRDQTLNGDTAITGLLTVKAGATLTIPEGIVLTVKEGAEVSVKGSIDIQGKLVVEHGGRFFRKEYLLYQEIIGPQEDVGSGYTPLLASYIGSIEVSNKGFHFPTGSVAHVARSSVRLWNETWTMEHESELTYDDRVAVNVSINGPDLSEDRNQFARIVYGFGSCNTETHAITPNTYYWLYNEKSNAGKWERFDGMEALSGDMDGASEAMLAWAQVFFHNARMTEPEITSEEATVYTNLVYDASRDTRNTYNLYIPTSAQPGKPVSLILFTHGGSWTGGAKEDFDYMCARFARLGYITADIDYRLFKADTDAAICMEDILDDMENCINAIYEQAMFMGYTIDKMATSGYSAGGHLALLYAYSRADAAAIPVELVFEQVGPADFTPEAFAPGIFQSQLTVDLFARVLIPDYASMTTEEKAVARAGISPITYVNADSVPTVMAYAGQDIIVGYQHGPILDQLLTENQVDHVFLTMPKSNHTCEYDSAVVDEYLRTSVEYCRKYLSSLK